MAWSGQAGNGMDIMVRRGQAGLGSVRHSLVGRGWSGILWQGGVRPYRVWLGMFWQKRVRQGY